MEMVVGGDVPAEESRATRGTPIFPLFVKAGECWISRNESQTQIYR